MAFPSRDRDRYLVRRFLCLACAALVVAITSLCLAFTHHRTGSQHPPAKQPRFASEPLVFPTSYCARRPVGLDFCKDMVYESHTGGEIGYARMSARWFSYRKFQIFNAKDEIAVVVTREVVQFTDKYTVEEKWPNATRFYVEFSWGRRGWRKKQYAIMDDHKNEIARSNHVQLELTTVIRLLDSRTNRTLGEVERGAYQLFPKWTARCLQNNSSEATLPGYILATVATITTMREMEDADDMESD